MDIHEWAKEQGYEVIPSSAHEGATHLVGTAACCREWPVALGGNPIGKCGLCGSKPVVKPRK